jgi:hypothetical protein
VGATEDASVSLYTVSDHPAAAVPTSGCQRVDGALETIEYVRSALGSNLESFVVVISAKFTDRHHVPPFPGVLPQRREAGTLAKGR